MSRPHVPLVLVLLLSPLAAQEEKQVHTTKSGLKYEILRPGEEGTNPKPGEKVKVHYTGWLEDGTKFDSSRDRDKAFSFTIGQGVIEGWSEGVALMTVGSKCRFTIPWKLAYGERGRGPIPPKANLIFEIELLKVLRQPPFTAPDPAKWLMGVPREKGSSKDARSTTATSSVQSLPHPSLHSLRRLNCSSTARLARWNEATRVKPKRS